MNSDNTDEGYSNESEQSIGFCLPPITVAEFILLLAMTFLLPVVLIMLQSSIVKFAIQLTKYPYTIKLISKTNKY